MGIAAFVAAVGVIFRKAILPAARVLTLAEEFFPLVQGDERAVPPVPPLRDRLVNLEARTEDSYREARAAKECSVAVLSALKRKGLEL